jgi:hypothetical protein
MYKKLPVIILIFLPFSIYPYDPPPFFNDLLWRNDEEIITNGIVEDHVSITCNTVNIKDGEYVMVYIWELNEHNNDLVCELETAVENNKINIEWEIDFDENICLNSKWEIEENDFTIPQYVFEIRYKNYKSIFSNILNVRTFIERQIVYEGSKLIAANRKYRIICGDDTRIDGTTTADGYIIQRDVVIGKTYFYLMDE